MQIEDSTITMEPDDLEALQWLARGYNFWWASERWKHESLHPAQEKAKEMAREILHKGMMP